MPAPLDCLRKFPLVFGAVPGYPARHYLPSFGHETTKASLVLIVDIVYLLLAKAADLSASAESSSTLHR